VARQLEVGNHKWCTLNTRLSSGTSAGTFAGPYINYRDETGTKNEPDIFLYQFQKRVGKSLCFTYRNGSRVRTLEIFGTGSTCHASFWDSQPAGSFLSDKSLLAIPAASTAHERLFSTAGNVMTKKRSRLTCDNMEELVRSISTRCGPARRCGIGRRSRRCA